MKQAVFTEESGDRPLPDARQTIEFQGRPLRVCVAGGDQQGWALDTEMRLARRNLATICELVDDEREADVLHSVWPENTAVRWRSNDATMPVVLSFSNEPFRLVERPYVAPLMKSALALIAQSSEAYQQLEKMDLAHRYFVPYPYEPGSFTPLERDAPQVQELKSELKIPEQAYVVGNFFRDTAGANLALPKRQKGIDLFVAMMEALQQRIAPRPLIVLLAGPRRHWARQQLSERGVEYRFYGTVIADDDIPDNILDHHTMSLLYNLCDIQVVPSRWEGGPRAVMECALTQTPLISRPVGIAPDVLPGELLFDNAAEGVELLARDVEDGFARERCHQVARNLERFADPATVAGRLREVYESAVRKLESGDSRQDNGRRAVLYPEYVPRTILGRVRRLAIRGSRRMLAGVSKSHAAGGTIVLWSNFQPPPYGGANQFLLALAKGLENRGYTVLKNDWQTPAEAHIFNAMMFDYAHLAQLRKLHPQAVFVHRVDGPMSRYRGTDPSENDDIIFGINQAMDATVFQSAYSLCSCGALGYEAVNPSIVRNTVDSDIFHAQGRPESPENDKIRLLSTSWSDNPKKGRDIFAALDRSLDFDRYEYRFLGRCEGEFENIQVLLPQPSKEVAQALRWADIFVFASAFESASNALTEALACGTPAVYLDSGGNAEIVGPGGLSFREPSEIPELLDTMAGNLALFRQSISIPSIDEIAVNYMNVIESARKQRADIACA